MKPKISIVMPAYNEEKRIVKTLKDYVSFFKNRGDFEILVITDGCTDGTVELVKELSRSHHQVKSKDFPKRLGKGGAVLKGFDMASGSVVAMTDADGATGPDELYRLIKNLGDYDGIIGSRWMKGSRVLTKQPLARRLASRGFNTMVRVFLRLPFKDTQCGAKVFRTDVVRGASKRVKTTGFAFDISLLHALKKDGRKVKEFPITWSDREMSTLKISRAVPRMFFAIMKLVFDF